MEILKLVPVEPAVVQAPSRETACTAELAECTCPDFCERDHDND
ncbi:MAG TPA: hypothetical protein VFA30_04310 [Gaiellaceae bacterium]|nr:hypothetical protein [Gaiellaceae bacterium]